MHEVTWAGSTPRCDIGNAHPLNGEFSDAKIPGYGQWGILCPACAKRFGVRYGTGHGQRYIEGAGGIWTKVEG